MERDAETVASTIQGTGIPVETFGSVSALCRKIEKGVGAVILASEVFSGEGVVELDAILSRQPEWSDIPFILMANRDRENEPNWNFLLDEDAPAHTLVLERPVYSKTLISAVRSALRSRRKQYQIREELREIRRIKAELLENQERMRLASRAARFGTYDSDLLNRSFYWSPEMKDILGLPDQRATPTLELLADMVHPDEEYRVRKMLENAYDPSGPGSVEQDYRIIRPDGTPRWVHVKGQVSFMKVGDRIRPVRSTGMVMDITERKMIREELDKERRLLATIMNSIPVMITIYDPKIENISTNDAVHRITGWTREDLEDNDLMELVYPDPEYREEVRIYMENLEKGFRDLRMVAKDGSIIESSWANIRLPDGRRAGVGLDLTDRRKAEEKLEAAKVKLMRQEKLAAVGTLAGGVAHDLRNPLAAIKSAAYLLDMVLEGSDPDVKKTLQIINDEVVASDRIISDLLDFARPKPPVRKRLDLRKLVNGAISRIQIPEKIQVNVHPFEEGIVFADPDQIISVFSSIIQNSLQSMPSGGTLDIGFRKLDQPKGIEISIEDTGGGIPDEITEKIFDPLFTTKTNGTGLGLSLAKTLMEMHGGVIEVKSEEGRGTIFVLHFPVGGLPVISMKRSEEMFEDIGPHFGIEELKEKGFRSFPQYLSSLYIYDLEKGVNTYINPEYTVVTGYDQDVIDNMTGKDFFELFHPEDRRKVAEHLDALRNANDNDLLEIEYRFRTKQGRWIRCLGRDSIYGRNPDGSVKSIIGTFIEINDNKSG